MQTQVFNVRLLGTPFGQGFTNGQLNDTLKIEAPFRKISLCGRLLKKLQQTICQRKAKKIQSYQKSMYSPFLLMDDVTSMNLVGSRMAIDHSLTHSLTRSILINLFIKLELSNFLLPPLLSVLFVQECSVVLRKVFDEGRLGRRTFLPEKWGAWERVCRAHKRLKSAIMVSCGFVS